MGTSNDGEFGANEWLVAEMYDQFAKDPSSVDEAWWPVLESYRKTHGAETAATAAPVQTDAAKPASSPAPAPAAPAAPAAEEPRPLTAPIPVVGAAPVARTTTRPAAPQPVPAQAPKTEPAQVAEAREDVVTPLR
ncbi:MAG TPA: multifunctional oxoglutarate decarboxylase/oxoglutarate dehydrogenase thiamine pyrophosphate-binding subunit/dihydrolipoyllysine-residue succinyltransferase subunit, partial [Microbacterium sp.]|nr:multifunctional oxoglutarate decarboxylase/oxoglutarate dehydrogenase thiamine pyrophosphate-binding subunit/dihydrolipoyllysine-residue succinyltransferase subunit [Microbacterium sp.]